jgi:murein DD-endopeptidase MepM/ murein hydrolase activator NlpD
MFRKKYMIAIVETENEKAHSALVSKIQLFLIIIGFLAFITVLTLPLNRTMRKIHSNLKLQKVRKENRLLRETLLSWENRTQEIASRLVDLKTENNRIKSITLPEDETIEFGVGGADSVSLFSLIDIPELKKSEIRIQNMEKEIDWLHANMSEMEKVVTSRMDQIAHYPSIKPVKGGWFTSYFGKRKDPFTNQIEDHPGLDISIRPGTKVYAPAAGTVQVTRTEVIPNKGYGQFILVDHGYGYKTLYGHLSKILVKEGQKVTRWDVLGLTGNTGKSTSPHLHYGVFLNGTPQDPMNFILE